MIEESVYGHRKRLDWVIGHLSPTDRIVEFGCGSGSMLTRPLLAAGYDVSGIDRDVESIESGRKLLMQAGLDPSRLSTTDLQDLETRPNVLIASEVLEHLPGAQLAETLEISRERLADDGLLLVAVANGYGWPELESFLWDRARFGAACDRLGVTSAIPRLKRSLLGLDPDGSYPSALVTSERVQRFTRDSVAQLLEQHGFAVQRPQGTVLFAGPFTHLLFHGVSPFMRMNNALGSLLPRAAAGFLVAARPRRKHQRTGDDAGAKDRSRAVWGATPAGAAHAADLEIGTKEFFDRVRTTRAEHELDFLDELLPQNPRARRVLEVGCGAGYDAFELCAAGADYVGIDLTPENPVRTRAHLRHHGHEAATLEADGERLPFRSASFDVVFSNGVLHHTPDLDAALAEARRVLVPGGDLRIAVYHRDSVFYWASLFVVGHVLRLGFLREPFRVRLAMIEQSEADVLPVVRVYSRRQLRQILERAGFQVESLFVRRLNEMDLPPVRTLGTRLWRRIPRRVLRALGRRFGWYLIAVART